MFLSLVVVVACLKGAAAEDDEFGRSPEWYKNLKRPPAETRGMQFPHVTGDYEDEFWVDGKLDMEKESMKVHVATLRFVHAQVGLYHGEDNKRDEPLERERREVVARQEREFEARRKREFEVVNNEPYDPKKERDEVLRAHEDILFGNGKSFYPMKDLGDWRASRRYRFFGVPEIEVRRIFDRRWKIRSPKEVQPTVDQIKLIGEALKRSFLLRVGARHNQVLGLFKDFFYPGFLPEGWAETFEERYLKVLSTSEAPGEKMVEHVVKKRFEWTAYRQGPMRVQIAEDMLQCSTDLSGKTRGLLIEMDCDELFRTDPDVLDFYRPQFELYLREHSIKSLFYNFGTEHASIHDTVQIMLEEEYERKKEDPTKYPLTYLLEAAKAYHEAVQPFLKAPRRCADAHSDQATRYVRWVKASGLPLRRVITSRQRKTGLACFDTNLTIGETWQEMLLNSAPHSYHHLSEFKFHEEEIEELEDRDYKLEGVLKRGRGGSQERGSSFRHNSGERRNSKEGGSSRERRNSKERSSSRERRNSKERSSSRERRNSKERSSSSRRRSSGSSVS